MSIFKQKPFIIAEVGSNWHSFDQAKDAISLAKAVGADAVKFQLFNPIELWGDVPGTHDMDITKFMIRDWVPKLAEKAKACGIEFMVTAFSPEGYREIDPHVRYHKVASCEANHVRILQTLVQLGKPVLLSTGALTVAEIKAAIDTLIGVPCVPLYCEAAYPACQVDMRKIALLRQTFKRDVGFSDHTTDYLEIPNRAFEMGAVVIEKHFNPHDLTDTPDAPHSIGCDQFKSMVRRLRGEEPCMLGPTKSEEPIILQHKRRCIATRDIAVGEVLAEGENFGFYRSLKRDVRGLSPWLVRALEGNKATREIKAGDGIAPEDVA